MQQNPVIFDRLFAQLIVHHANDSQGVNNISMKTEGPSLGDIPGWLHFYLSR